MPTYYIGPNGDYSSIANFKTAVPSPATSSKVYLECGNTFVNTSQWDISWGGTSGDRAVIGSYYYSGSRIIGLSGSKPKISGNNNTYPNPNVAPPVYQSLIRVYNKDYVNVENIHFTESRGSGLIYRGDWNNNLVSSKYFIVDNCDFTNNYQSAVEIAYCNDNYGIVRNCFAYNNVLAGDRYLKFCSNHPVCMVVISSPNANTIFENNTLIHNYGETLGGFSAGVHTTHVTFRNNYLTGIGAPLLYIDGISDIEVYGNKFISGNYSGAGGALGGVNFASYGVHINSEVYPNGATSVTYDINRSYNINIYNNFFACCADGIGIGDEHKGAVINNLKIYNNTFIACYHPIKRVGVGPLYTNCEMKNNLIFKPTGTVQNTIENQLSGITGWTNSHNAGKGPSWGSNYITLTDSDMATAITTAWQQITKQQLLDEYFTDDEFKLSTGSTLKNKGVSLGLITHDYFGNAREGLPDIGAHELTSATPYTYNWYFSNSTGNDSNNGSQSSPWKTLSKMNSQIALIREDIDTANIYMKRGDTWTLTSNTGIVISKSNVNINAYSTGALPKIDGNNTYPNSTSEYVVVIGKNSASAITNWSIKNIKIQNLHNGIRTSQGGGAIIVDGDTSSGHYGRGDGEISACKFVDIGWCAINLSKVPNTSGIISIENNIFTKVNNYAKANSWSSGWLEVIRANDGYTYGHEIRNNKIYNCYSEGIGATGFGVIENNVLWNLKSTAIFANGSKDGNGSAFANTIRYNLIFYLSGGYANVDGILVNDTESNGDNTSRSIEIYGNIVAGQLTGINIKNDYTSNFGSIKVYNNTLIDNDNNFSFADMAEFTSVDIRNNASLIHSDSEGSCNHITATDTGDTSAWTVGPNFYFGDSLDGEEDLPAWATNGTNVFGTVAPIGKSSGWRSLTTIPLFSDMYPISGSELIDRSETDQINGYSDLITSGTNWSSIPS